MKKCYLILVLAAVLASCAKNDVAMDEQPIAASINKIYASIGDDTRVQLNQELKSVWNAGDEITSLAQRSIRSGRSMVRLVTVWVYSAEWRPLSLCSTR